MLGAEDLEFRAYARMWRLIITSIQDVTWYRWIRGSCLATGIRHHLESDIAGFGTAIARADIDAVQVGVGDTVFAKQVERVVLERQFARGARRGWQGLIN